MAEEEIDTGTFEWRGETRDVTGGKRRPGRPRGSTARIVVDLEAATKVVDPAQRLPDIGDMLNRQLAIVSAAQDKITVAMAGGDLNVRAVSDLSTALTKAVQAVASASKAQETILARLSLAQHLEGAIRRLEDQDAGVIRYAIRRLKRVLDGERPEDESDKLVTAATAISELDDP